ncbi:MarR family transcriptional regulator [Nocardioides sp.]|uniref:MarR family winged helix-turn-helix transcriptional regulator n=1 Tax=Nocardioides sp. TaxID=35761 RepID=UPI0031FF284C
MRPPSGAAFLLAQLGAHTSNLFAARLAELGLSPAHVGVLRIVGQSPGLSQQALSERLGAVPSRVVKLVDELEARGLVERRRSETDRRNYALHIADGAAAEVAAVRRAVGAHDSAVVKSLTAQELETLLVLLRKIAEAEGLNAEVHPGYGARGDRSG